MIKTEFTKGIKHIIMCDIKTRNSLSIKMMDTLLKAITTDKDSKDLRAIVIEAEGPVFSAGHNLKELKVDYGKEQHQKIFFLASELMLSIIKHPVPIIAKVDGLAAAAGCQLVAQCDIAICSKESQFSTPGVNYGIFCSTPGVALARCVPKMMALHMLFTGNPISAEEAKICGLVSKVVLKEKLNEEINAICDAISLKSRSVVQNGKRFFYRQIDHDIRTAYEMGAEEMVSNVNTAEGQEGITSFIEKRKPVWLS